MPNVSIPHGAMVFIGDGERALFLRNKGDRKFPNLVTERVVADNNPPTHRQGADRPGRTFKRAGTNQRSAVETTDWHRIEKERFARRIGDSIEQLVRAQKVKALIVVAPPRTLAELRLAFHPDVKRCILAELDKDLTHLPVYEIEQHLVGAHSAEPA